MDFVRFAILGLGAGAIYGLTALGVVIIYRGSGVLNFAQGAVGMVGAYLFYDARASGVPTGLAWVEAIGLGILIGALTHLFVMRPLRSAPVLSRIIATLGLLTILLGYAQHQYGQGAKIISKMLPIDGVEVLPDISIGEDRLIILGIGVALTAALWVTYRYMRFGLATSAVAQSRRVTAAQGISPDLVATLNWGLGSGLAVIAAILIVNISQLQVVGLTLLVVPAFAAALVGGFRSFPLTFAGGLLIGFLEAEVQWLQGYLTRETGHPFALEGWTESIPFIVIILVLVVRGRALPLRGEGVERPPEVGSGRVRPLLVGAAVALVAVAVTTLLSVDLVESVTTTSILAIVVLSLVVVTGYTGQLSLAQFALAGMGAWFAVQSIVILDFPFELAFVAGVAAAVPVGILVGTPVVADTGCESCRRDARTRADHPVPGVRQRGPYRRDSRAANRRAALLRYRLRHLPIPGAVRVAFLRLLRGHGAPGGEPPSRSCRSSPDRGADERARCCFARNRGVRGEALRVRALGRHRRGWRDPARFPSSERRVLPDVLDLRIHIRRGVRGDRRDRIRRRCGSGRKPRAWRVSSGGRRQRLQH